MIRYREILRLRSKGISIRNIAYSVECSKNTVQSVIRKASAKGLSWPLPESIDDAEIYHMLFSDRVPTGEKVEPDFEWVNQELLKKGVTLMLLWNEYCQSCLDSGAEPYQYSAFCRRYNRWAESARVVAHLEHRPAERMMVDWAGSNMETVDPDSGQTHKVYVFVACLPYSSYLFAQGYYSMDSESWMRAHIAALEHFGGVAAITVPDNLKTGIIKHTLDELIVNENYRRLAEYYGFAIMPARVRRPRDKASVESGVAAVTRSGIAPLRNQVFFTLADLNDALAEKVETINARPFQKREGSRESVFINQEKDALCPLPAKRFEVYVTKTATVPYNYHVSVDSLFYSVPYTHAKRSVEIRITESTVSIYSGTERIAMHKRSYARRGTYITNPDHMPEAHKDYVEWNAKRFRRWAAQIGPSTEAVIDIILASRPIEQQTYRSARAVMALGQKHGDGLLESACKRSLAITHAPSYKTVKTLIARIADDAPDPDNEFAYLRGADYFDQQARGDEIDG